MVMMHAENSDCIAWLTEKLESEGRIAPKYHAEARPVPVEREATQRAITLAELADVPILLVHVSSADAVDQIRWGQSRGLRIYGETCPQYILLTADDLDQPGFEGAKCICSPPLRGAADHRAIWNGLTSGVFQIFSSDHAPFRYDDAKGKKLKGESASFAYVPNGIPGIETRMPLLFSEGVNGQRLDVNAFVALTATNPAKLYGLYPRKGTIAVGADADIAIWDAECEVTITKDLLHDSVDYTPYEGVQVRGWPVTTLSRGMVVWGDGEFKGQQGYGKFLPADLPDPARPRPDQGSYKS